MVCESTKECTQGYDSVYIIIEIEQSKSHVQYIIENEGKISDGKLLSKYKMPLMEK